MLYSIGFETSILFDLINAEYSLGASSKVRHL